MPRGLLDRLPHLIVAVKVEDIGDEIQCILVVLDLRVQPSQVEPIRKVILVDLAEIFVATRGNELRRAMVSR